MEDPHVDRRIRSPLEVYRRIHEIREQSQSEISIQDIQLQNPFDYLSVEEIPENSDLLPYLYTDNVPWLKQITNFGTTLVSGPRGSGKSMILKNMRLITQLTTKNFNKDTFSKLRYLGFYIHCHHSLYIPFAGFGIKWDNDTLEKFVHYLNLLFTAEILEALITLDKRRFTFFSPRSKESLGEFLRDNIFEDDLFYLSTDNLLSHYKSMIEKAILLTQRRITEDKRLKRRTTVGYIANLTNKLDNTFEFFRSKAIYFLLDEYSLPKVNSEIQESLNRIIGFRNNRFCFKISAEKFGFITRDLDGKDLQQDREFVFIDLGERYINYDKPERKQFINEILSKRLKRAKISRSPEQIFGPASQDIASALLEEKQRGLKSFTVKYSGFNTIYRLCMGDLSTILQLCKEMYISDSKGKSRKYIDDNTQDQIIRNFSKHRLEMMKEIPSLGQALFHLVEIFGHISKKYLYEYNKLGGNIKHKEVTRIELKEDIFCLTSSGEELCKKLITEHIFLDASGAYLWKKGISNLQLLLRPIYAPALSISYNNRHPLRISCRQFETFLTNPDEFAKIELQAFDEGAITLDKFSENRA